MSGFYRRPNGRRGGECRRNEPKTTFFGEVIRSQSPAGGL
jgi:hypothetical protein